MTDNISPIAQFHPYKRPEDVPVAEREPGRIDRVLSRLGADPARLRVTLDRARTWARTHPGRLLSAMAVAVIGAGVVRSRFHRGPHHERV